MEITERQIQILHGRFCPYCGNKTEYVDSMVIYGKSYGMIYLCRPCDAYVGVHHGYSKKALGRVANKELREWKKKAHEQFDKIWRFKIKKRTAAYAWLSEQLGIPKQYTHIGMFSVETCKKVVKLCEQLLKDNWRVRQMNNVPTQKEKDDFIQPSGLAIGLSSGYSGSKKLAAYLASFPDNYEEKV